MNSKILQCRLDELISQLEKIPTDLLLVVIDSNVWQLFKQSLNFVWPGKKVIVYTAIPGEDSKSFREFEKCLEYFLSRGIHRHAHLVAIGGGAVTDMAGFVASTLLRGIPWHVVPTTLLSMIDASIGGKVAINSQSGKNLIGAFHAPHQVFLVQDFLQSLPKEEYWSGTGELLKYTMLNAEIYKTVQSQGNIQASVIWDCAQYKKTITDGDFKEKGLRKILNLGHTIGHALEWHYRLSHGEAVFWGLLSKLTILDCTEAIKELKQLANLLQWPKREAPWYQKKIPIEALAEIMMKDKKMHNENIIHLTKVEKPGHYKIIELPFQTFIDEFKKHENQLRTLGL